MSKSFITHDVSKQMRKQDFQIVHEKNIFKKRGKKLLKSITYIF